MLKGTAISIFFGRANYLRSDIVLGWIRQKQATLFPLLTRVSEVGEVSLYLSKQREKTKNQILRMPNLEGLLS